MFALTSTVDAGSAAVKGRGRSFGTSADFVTPVTAQVIATTPGTLSRSEPALQGHHHTMWWCSSLKGHHVDVVGRLSGFDMKLRPRVTHFSKNK